MDVSVIIVSYNSTPVLKPCLDSLRDHDFAARTEVIVVDNASSDGTPDMVRRDYPWVKLVAGDENLGYSKGVNVGIRHATGRFFFILNPDTAVKRDSIRVLVDYMDANRDVGIAGPKLVFHDGNTQLSCRRFYTFKVLLLRRTPLGKIFRNSRSVEDHLMLDFDHESTMDVDWILGAAMFVRREAVESVGLMDERFFLYFEDVDWCYRMKQNGLRVVYHPASVVVHGYQRESAQSVLNRSFVSHLVSLFRYYEKWNFVVYFLKRYREIAKIGLFLVLDLLAFNAAFFAAYYLRVALSDVFTNPLYPIAAYGKFVLFENLLFVFTFAVLGLYRVRRETRSADEFFDVSRAIVLASVLLMTSTYLGRDRTYSRLVVAFVVPFAVLFDWTLRGAVRRLHRRVLAHKVDLKRVCIVGPRTDAKRLEMQLSNDDELGLDVVGIIDTTDSDQILTGALGSLDDIERTVQKHRIQEVVVMPGALGEDRLSKLVDMGRRRVLDVTVQTGHLGMVYQQAEVSDLQGRPVLRYARNTRYAIDRAVKRLFDILVGAVLMVVSLPLYMVYSLYALSRGVKPITFSDRFGLEGEPFTIPMAGGDRPNGPSDFVNLPLFWLVVIGKMSLVGPYALPPEEAASVDTDAHFRFEMRPGVTGPWRDSRRTAVTLNDLLAQDAGYVRGWSLWLDLKLFTTTLWRMIRGHRRSVSLGGAGLREGDERDFDGS